jgi:alpha-amylase
VKTTDWATSKTEVLTTSPHGIAILKGHVLSVLTTVGSPPKGAAVAVYTPFETSTATTEYVPSFFISVEGAYN